MSPEILAIPDSLPALGGAGIGLEITPLPGTIQTFSMRDKVRSLRIGDSDQAARPGNTVLLMASAGWCLAFAATGTSILLGYKAYHSPGDFDAELKAETTKVDVSDAQTRAPQTRSSAVGGVALVAEQVVLESKGYITPVHLILVTPKVGGMLTRLNIKEGDIVDKGKVLSEIEKIDYEADVSKAESFLFVAKHRLEELVSGARPEERAQADLELQESQRQLKQLELDLVRTKRLRGSGSISERDLEQAQYSCEAMQQKVKRLEAGNELIRKGPRKERVDAARAEVRQLEAELGKARWRLDNCTIRAPISGMILSKKAEENNIVNPGAFNGSFSLCEMADLCDLEVELDIQERDIGKLFLYQECAIIPEAWQSNKQFLAIHPKGYSGFVSRIMPTANRSKGAVPVRVRILVPRSEQGVYLKPDLGTMVTFFNRELPGLKRAEFDAGLVVAPSLAR